MKRIVGLLIFLFGCVCTAKAQYDASFSHKNNALSYYNPASAGRTGHLDILAMYSLKMAGWNSKTMFISANMPLRFLKKEHGVGILAVNDTESSLYGSLSIGLQYAYLKKIGKGTLRVGVQLGMINRKIGGDEIITPDSTDMSGSLDEAIPTGRIDAKAFDANAGIYYATDKWYVGAGVTHLTEPKFEEEHLKSFINRGYNFIAGYNIRFKNSLFEMQPSVFMQTNFNVWQVDVAARAVYAGKYSMGLSWRSNDAIALLLGATFGKIEGGYAYSVPVSSMAGNTFGGHELFLKYKLPLNKPKTGKSKHKSVRIL
jgi:type IX secretion system PorP/SprF family membrane protein